MTILMFSSNACGTVCGVGHEVLASYFVAISQRVVCFVLWWLFFVACFFVGWVGFFFVLVGNEGSPF